MTEPVTPPGMPGRIAARVPVIRLVRAYDRAWIRPDITLALVRLKSAVAEYLARAGVLEKVGADRVYLEVDDAVAAFKASGTDDTLPAMPG